MQAKTTAGCDRKCEAKNKGDINENLLVSMRTNHSHFHGEETKITASQIRRKRAHKKSCVRGTNEPKQLLNDEVEKFILHKYVVYKERQWKGGGE